MPSHTKYAGALASLALALPPLAQQPAPRAELPAGAAAVVDGRAISLDEYKDYLLAISGRRPLEELVYRNLLEREAEHQDLVPDASALERDFDAVWAAQLDKHGGSAALAEAELAEAGLDRATYRSRYLAYGRVAQLESALCGAARAPGEVEITARFERDYGPGGVRLELAHVLIARASTRAELARAGATPEQLAPARVEERMRARARELSARAAAGEDFAGLARAHSHDLATRASGGTLTPDELARFGAALEAAARGAAAGEVVGPLESEAGLHLVRVTDRTATRLVDVRGEIERALKTEPPSAAERKRLRERLFAAAEIAM